MSEMVERVAMAMWAKKEQLTPNPRVSWENAEAKDQAFMLEVARAAIEAMREPTEAMKDAGGMELAGLWDSDDSPYSAAENVWLACIDAALK